MLKCNTFILTPVNLTVHAGMYFSCIPRRLTRPQTFSSPCRGPSRPTRPYGRFLSTVITHAVLLVHTDVFSPLLQSIQVNPSTQKKPTQAYQSILYPTKGSLLSPGGHLDISSLLTFPAISELTPVHKDIWRLLEFPVHSEFA